MDGRDRPADLTGVTSSSAPEGVARTVLPSRTDRSLAGAGAAAVVGSAALALVLVLRPGGPDVARLVTDLVTPVAAGVAVAACARAALAGRGRLRAFWALLAAACLLWALAEVTWAFYELGLDRDVPTPSWADLGYLAAVPVAAAALLVHPAADASSTGRSRSVLDGLAVATSLALLTWSYALGPLWSSSDLSTAGGLVAVAYPFTDVVLLFLVVLSIVRADSGDRGALWWVLAGLVAMSVSDSVYTYLATTGGYVSGDVVDAGWVAGYLGIAVGGYGAAGRSLPAEGAWARGTAPIASAVAPYVPVLLALLVLPSLATGGAGLDAPVWFLALVLVVLVLARQLLVAVDRLRPAAAEEALR